MRIHILQREQVLPLPPEEVFPFFAAAENLDRITPPWLRFRIITPTPIAMGSGTEIDYRLRYRGVPVRWRTRIEEWSPNELFVDRALRSPYALWLHAHEFEPLHGARTRMRDVVQYAMPLGALGAVAHQLFVRRDVERIFDYRRLAIESLLSDGNFRGERLYATPSV